MPLLLMIHASDQIAADNRVHAVVKLDSGGLPASELATIVGVLDQIAADEGPGGPFWPAIPACPHRRITLLRMM